LSQGKKVTIKLTNIQDQSFNFSFSYFKYPNITNIRMKVDIYREKANSSRETQSPKHHYPTKDTSQTHGSHAFITLLQKLIKATNKWHLR